MILKFQFGLCGRGELYEADQGAPQKSYEEEEEGNNDSDREAHLRNLKLIFDTVGMRLLIYFYRLS